MTVYYFGREKMFTTSYQRRHGKKKHSWVNGDNCKAPCSNITNPMTFCTDGEGLNMSFVSVQVLTLALK